MRAARLEAVRADVAAREPVDERERASIARLLGSLATLPRPFDRDADPTHLTASGIVVGPRGVLLHRHKHLDMWLQPGGHIDGDEAPAEAARRETAEETGVDAAQPSGGPQLVHVDVHHVAHKGHTHLDLRYLLHADADPAPPPGESREVRWFSWPEALGIADAGLIGALEALRP